jgi:hypothetical protein
LAQEEVLPETVGTEINNADLKAEAHSATRFNFLLPLIGVADYKSVIKSREILGGIGISKQTTALAVALAELMDCGLGSRIHPLADESRVSASHAKLGFKVRGATEDTPPRPLFGALLFGMTEKYQLHRTPVELRQLQKLGIEAVKKVEWGQFSGMVRDHQVTHQLRSLQEYHTNAGSPPAEAHQRGGKKRRVNVSGFVGDTYRHPPMFSLPIFQPCWGHLTRLERGACMCFLWWYKVQVTELALFYERHNVVSENNSCMCNRLFVFSFIELCEI